MENNIFEGCTKKSLKERCKIILYKAIEEGNKVCNKDDFDFLLKVFSFHQEWDLKKDNQEIVEIIVKSKNRYKTPCFYLVRADGSETDISYPKSVDHVSIEANVRNACRMADLPRVNEYKKSIIFPYTYTLNNVTTTINNLNEMEVDHYDMDFKDLVKIWVSQNGGYDVLVNYINPTKDGDADTRFINSELVQSFAKFARENSKLRPLSQKDNRSTRKKKIPSK